MGVLNSKIVRTTKMAGSQDVKNFIKEAISQEKVVVFSKSYCPYCKLAKDVFKKVKQPIKVYELDERDDGDTIQDNLQEVSGFRTVANEIGPGMESKLSSSITKKCVSVVEHWVGTEQVPQVFINGKCVGGGSDVKALYDSGKLEPLLIG